MTDKTIGEKLAANFLDEISDITGCDIEGYTLTKWADLIDKEMEEKYQLGYNKGRSDDIASRIDYDSSGSWGKFRD